MYNGMGMIGITRRRGFMRTFFEGDFIRTRLGVGR